MVATKEPDHNKLAPRCFTREGENKFASNEVGHGDEVGVGTITPRPCLGGLKEAVKALDQASGQAAMEPVEDAIPMVVNGLGGGHHWRQAAMGCPAVPAFQECFPFLPRGGLEQFSGGSGGSDRPWRS